MKILTDSRKGSDNRNNQDVCSAMEVKPGTLLLSLADGMGGLAAGDLAATTVVSHISDCVSINISSCPASASLKEALAEADNQLTNISRSSHIQLGATVALAIFESDGENLTYTWQGNVRIYIHDSQGWHQLTKDHVLPTGHGDYMITRCLKGHGLRDDVPYECLCLKDADHILVCSDGFYDVFKTLPLPTEIQDLFNKSDFADDASFILVSK